MIYFWYKRLESVARDKLAQPWTDNMNRFEYDKTQRHQQAGSVATDRQLVQGTPASYNRSCINKRLANIQARQLLSHRQLCDRLLAEIRAATQRCYWYKN